jgi:tetratricopeptide (TPR) repeat protein
MAAIVIAQVAYYTSDAPRMLAGSLLSLRLGSPRMADASVGRSYAYLGYLAGVMRLHKTAGKLFRQAEARSADHGDVMGLAYAHGGEALYHLGFGRWSLAAPAIEASLDACRSIGDPHLTEMALTLRAMLHYFKGDFIQSKEDFAEINKSAKTRLSQHHLAWGVYGRAENLLRLGKARQAGRLIGIAKTLLQGQSDLHSELICHGLDAMAKLQLGNFVDARLAAVSAIDLARTIVPNNFSSLEGYAAPIEALLELRAAEPASESTLKETRRLKEAFKSLTNYARLFPIGRPRLWYLRGLRSQVSGDPRRTTKHWLRSLNWAHDLDMRYEEYRACEALLHFGSLAPAELRHIEARAGQLSAEGGYRPNRIGNLH